MEKAWVAAEAGIAPEEINWPPRQSSAIVRFEVVRGRPVCPGAPTGRGGGLGDMGTWGETKAVDIFVTATLNGERQVLMVYPDDNRGWALPGGHIDPGESAAEAAVRELAEETGVGIVQCPPVSRPLEPRYVDDPRGTDEAWFVTQPFEIDLGPVAELPSVKGGSDARRAAWVPARTYDSLAAVLVRDYGGAVFPGHADMLQDFLAPARF
jgi:ADP-ribose pyrophosphatase